MTLDNGTLLLKLSEDCQNNGMFEIETNDCKVDQNVRLIPSKNKKAWYLTPKCDAYRNIKIICQNGAVRVQSASWVEMLKMQFKK